MNASREKIHLPLSVKWPRPFIFPFVFFRRSLWLRNITNLLTNLISGFISCVVFHFLIGRSLLSWKLVEVVLHPGPYFWRLCAFSQNKVTSEKVSNGSDKRCSKGIKNRQFYFSRDYGFKITVINIFHVLIHKSINTWVGEILVQ